MLERHPSGDGDTHIFNMSDNHLENMIRFMCKQIKAVRLNIKKHANEDSAAEYRSLMYGGRKFDVEEAVKMNKKMLRQLYPYLAEAFLRGLTNTREELIEAIDRDSGVDIHPLLSSTIEVDGQQFVIEPKIR